MKKNIALLLLVLISLTGGKFIPWRTAAGFGLWAQTSASNTSNLPDMPATHFDMTGFPQWTKDLRRIEIIAFGSFPFAYFFSNFAFDTYRCSNNGWDRRYAPWPFDSAGSIDKTKDERIATICIAAGAAVFISLVDYSIVLIKRHKREKEIKSLSPGTPIIIRKPLNGEEAEDSGTETGDAAGSSGAPEVNGNP